MNYGPYGAPDRVGRRGPNDRTARGGFGEDESFEDYEVYEVVEVERRWKARECR